MAKIGAGAGGDAAATGLAKTGDAMKAVSEQADAMAGSVAKADDALKGAGGTADAAAASVGRYADAAKAATETSAGLGDASAAGAAGLDAQAASAAASRDVLAETAIASDKAAVSAERAGKTSKASAEGGGWGVLKTTLLGVGVAAAYGIDKAMKFQSPDAAAAHPGRGVREGHRDDEPGRPQDLHRDGPVAERRRGVGLSRRVEHGVAGRQARRRCSTRSRSPPRAPRSATRTWWTPPTR